MQYITFKRFKRNGIGGYFNIPYGTPLELHDDGILYHKGLPVCVAKSAASHNHFARDDDGKGLERGKLSHAIIDSLASVSSCAPHEGYHLWQAILSDQLTQKYRRKQHLDYWLWSDDFYNAPIDDLKHIAQLADVKGL